MRSRALVVLLSAALLTGAPARPAHAGILEAALSIITAPLTLIFGNTAKLEAVIMVVETKLPVMLTELEFKQKQKLAVALDEAKKMNAKKKQDALTKVTNTPDLTQAACIASQGGPDMAAQEVVGKNQAQAVLRQFGNTRNRGAVLGATDDKGKKSNNPTRQQLAEAQVVCRYGNENDAAAIKQLCPPGTPAPKDNPYKGANKRATTVINTTAFDDDRGFVAGMDFCNAMTGNLPLPYAQGRALTESIENILQFNAAMSDTSTQAMAAYHCLMPVYRKMPIDGKFAKNDPKLQGQLASFKAFVENSVITAGDQTDTSAFSRTPANMDKRARTFLMQGGGYTEVDPPTIKLDEPGPGASRQLIKGQMVSTEQFNQAEYIYKWTSKDFMEGVDNGKAIKKANVFITRAYNTQLMWHQYEQLERDVLMEAVALARMTRDATADPGVVTPQ